MKSFFVITFILFILNGKCGFRFENYVQKIESGSEFNIFLEHLFIFFSKLANLPGVSTIVSLRLTPDSLRRTLFVSTATVFLILADGPGEMGEYMSVRNMELIRVDLPNPDSPTTIRVNSNPRLTAFL